MSYEQLTDFEINKAYLKWKYRDVSCLVYLLNTNRTAAVAYLQRSDKEMVAEEVFDVNNPADAWPIINENGISVINEGEWFACKKLEGNGGSWDYYHEVTDTNPLRAAMIVFLMMNEVVVDD